MPGTEQEWNELHLQRLAERRLPRFVDTHQPEKTPVEEDAVNHPKHYNANGDIECIDAIKASMSPEEYKGYLKGNTIKYLWRYNYKGKPKQDLEKAKWYLERLIAEV